MSDIVSQVPPSAQVPRYHLSGWLIRRFLWSAVVQRPRSFAFDAQRAIRGIEPELVVLGAGHIPPRGPCLVTCNHYSRPGFGAWWITLPIAAAVAAHRHPDAQHEIHWVMTAAWTFPDSPWKRQVLTPLTRWAFRRAARVYGFVPMPPMPPDPGEVNARASAVLRTVHLARRIVQQGGMVGLAPEGRDIPEELRDAHGLGPPPEGAGDFVALLVRAGLPVLPVGVTEHQGQAVVSFGAPFLPEVPEDRALRDGVVSQQVMGAIRHALACARHLPREDQASADCG